MDVDSQPTMEETILVGDDLMLGPPSPVIPPEIASHVLEGVDLCDGILRNLFLCLQINDIEPFCQDEIVLYRQCAEERDKELRQRLQDGEHKLGLCMPLEQAKERAAQVQSEVALLERRMILASGIEGMEGVGAEIRRRRRPPQSRPLGAAGDLQKEVPSGTGGVVAPAGPSDGQVSFRPTVMECSE